MHQLFSNQYSTLSTIQQETVCLKDLPHVDFWEMLKQRKSLWYWNSTMNPGHAAWTWLQLSGYQRTCKMISSSKRYSMNENLWLAGVQVIISENSSAQQLSDTQLLLHGIPALLWFKPEIKFCHAEKLYQALHLVELCDDDWFAAELIYSFCDDSFAVATFYWPLNCNWSQRFFKMTILQIYCNLQILLVTIVFYWLYSRYRTYVTTGFVTSTLHICWTIHSLLSRYWRKLFEPKLV